MARCVTVAAIEFDHAVIHIDDWDACNKFYADVLEVELVENPEGQANPLGAWAYRLGGQQINVHGPWPGLDAPCCPPPLNEVGERGVVAVARCHRRGRTDEAVRVSGLGNERVLPRSEWERDRTHVL
jgi:catechol 2,3-dioxygenase-like lactoylglutathione lyase family enzyme